VTIGPLRLKKAPAARSFAFFLAVFLIAALAPMAAFTAWMARDLIGQKERSIESDAEDTIQTIAYQIDAELHTAAQLLQVLSKSQALTKLDLDHFGGALSELAGAAPFAISLEDAAGRILLDSRTIRSPPRALDPPIWDRAEERVFGQWRLVQTSSTAFELSYAIEVTNGAEKLILRASFRPELLGLMMRGPGLPRGQDATLAVPDGRIVARSLDRAGYIGRPLPHPIDNEQAWTGRNADGVSVVSFIHHGSSGLVYVISVAQEMFERPLIELIWRLAGLLIAVALTTLLATALVRHRLTLAVQQLTTLARSAPRQSVEAPRTALAEANLIGQALAEALNRLHQKNETLQTSHGALERMVGERTHLLDRTSAELAVSDARLTAAMSHVNHGLAMFDNEQRLVVANERFMEIYGLTDMDLVPGRHIKDVLFSIQASGYLQNRDGDEITRSAFQQASAIVDAGQGKHVVISRSPMPGGWITTHQDVSDLIHTESELRRTKTFLDAVIDKMPIAISVKDPKTRKMMLVNGAYERLVDVTRERIIGHAVHEYLPEDLADAITREDEIALAARGRAVLHERDAPVPHRERLIVTSTRLAVCDDDKPRLLITLAEDVTEHRVALQRLAWLAHHDSLTGLLNRAAFVDKLRTLRDATPGGKFAVFFIDLDGFKGVNDTFGHKAGDELLALAARRLAATAGDTAIVARLGGDEFGILLADCHGRNSVEDLARRLVACCREPLDIYGASASLNVTCSIGIALSPSDGVEADELLTKADLSLYEAKAQGRNGWLFYSHEIGREAVEREAVALELRKAVLSREFEVHYQPILDSNSQEVVCVEALLRWRHAERGFIRPDIFIPIAEETGLIGALGEFVLNTACRDAMTWPQRIKVAVNISARQFLRHDLAEVVTHALAASGLAPQRLELEITETALLKDYAEHLPTLRRLKSWGVSVALDDFGTGYSALSQLSAFPFDKIKIDRSFTRNLAADGSDMAIIRAVQYLAAQLGMETTAEGIETPEQYLILRSAGIDQMQGFLFARPQPVSSLRLTDLHLREVEERRFG
jgi:diguanylate cyclase (GGDEF)-like protein/PAS domain S-box-containing protein